MLGVPQDTPKPSTHSCSRRGDSECSLLPQDQPLLSCTSKTSWGIPRPFAPLLGPHLPFLLEGFLWGTRGEDTPVHVNSCGTKGGYKALEKFPVS